MAVASTSVALAAKTLSASLTTHVYTDANGNGTQDTGDASLAGVTVSLLNANGTATGKTAVTDARGNVTFSGLAPGSCGVRRAAAGDKATQKVNVQSRSRWRQAARRTPSRAFTPRQLTTHVYTDANGNGTQDAGDASLPA